tara:strand:- start:496 stop:738 length:243 start_codon:yes stop_codon:yes gene_type:complete
MRNMRNENRAASVAHAEYEILMHIIERVDLTEVAERMAIDDVSTKRVEQAGGNVLVFLENMMERRRHKLKPTHVDYKGKE